MKIEISLEHKNIVIKCSSTQPVNKDEVLKLINTAHTKLYKKWKK